jgi:hypothetical protein
MPAGPPPITAKRRRSESLTRRFGKLEFARGAGIDHARNGRVDQRTVDAGLIARDASVDERRLTGGRLGNDASIGEKRTRHRNEVCAAGRDRGVRRGQIVDAIAGNDRQLTDGAFDARGKACPNTAWNHLLNGWDRRLVPADADVERVDAVTAQCARELEGFVAGRRLRHQVGARNAKDDGILAAGSRANRAQDFAREAHSPREVPAPRVVAPVRYR